MPTRYCAEVLKTCLDYWNRFVPDVFSSVCVANTAVASGGMSGFGAAPAGQQHPRAAMYAQIMQQLRLLMIERMARPEEVRASCSSLFQVFTTKKWGANAPCLAFCAPRCMPRSCSSCAYS